MDCARCGAPVESAAVACPYCGSPTPNAERARAEEQARQDRAIAQRAEGVRREQSGSSQKMEQAATRSLVLSLIGFFVCFIPILQIISLVYYMRARSLARQASADLPAQATIGMVLSSLSLIMLIAGLTWAIVSDGNNQERADARIAALDVQTKTSALQPSLDWPTACALAEAHALKDGYAGEKGRNLVHFDCVSKVTEQSGRPMLEHFSFRSDSNDKRYDVAVCFRRDAKWFVAELNESRTCPDPAAAAATRPASL